MKKHLLFLGAPGAGKGTQAPLLSQTNSFLHLSTGELLRKEIEMNTILGIQVEDIMNRGELVSDELTSSPRFIISFTWIPRVEFISISFLNNSPVERCK